MVLVLLKHEININNKELVSKKMRYFWMILLMQNTILFVFNNLFIENFDKTSCLSLIIYEILTIILNLISFILNFKFRKSFLLKIFRMDIMNQEHLLTEKEENETDIETNLAKEEQTISSFDIVNKFMSFYEKEEPTKRAFSSINLLSDEESPQLNGRRSDVFYKFC